MNQGRRGPRERAEGSTGEEILKAAYKAFAHYGYEGTTVRQIAREAGVDPAMISYRFGSKEKLWRAVLENLKERLQFFIQKAEALADRNAEDAAYGLIDLILEISLENPEFPMIISQSAGSAAFDEVRKELIDPFITSAVPALSLAMEAGVFPKSDPKMALFILLSGVSVTIMAYDGDKAKIRNKIDAFLKQMVRKKEM